MSYIIIETGGRNHGKTAAAKNTIYIFEMLMKANKCAKQIHGDDYPQQISDYKKLVNNRAAATKKETIDVCMDLIEEIQADDHHTSETVQLMILAATVDILCEQGYKTIENELRKL